MKAKKTVLIRFFSSMERTFQVGEKVVIPLY